MERYFGFDTRFAKVMTKAADLILLNALFLAACIPVFTIGSAAAALYSVTMQMCKNEESYIVKSFWNAFRKYFRKATILWGLIAGTGFFLLSSFRAFGSIDSIFLKGGVLAAAFLWLLIVPYLIPYAVKFDKPIGKTLRDGMLLSLRYMGSSLIIFGTRLTLIACIVTGGKVFYHLLAFMTMIGFSALAYMGSNIYNCIFEKYMS